MQKSLRELAELTQAELEGDENYLISGVDELSTATPADVSFLNHAHYASLLKKSKAGAVCVSANTIREKGKNYLISSNPSLVFQKIMLLFLSNRFCETGFSGIHESAVIHPTACIAPGVTIGPHATIDAYTRIDQGTTIGPNVVIGPFVEIGAECKIYSHVTIREGCKIGQRVIIQPGAVIGSCGFGYLTDQNGIHHKQQHLGIVVLEDDVEIGANTTIDRARFKETRIGKGTKIDNLVQIAHNVAIGSHSIIVALSGISGSTKAGNHVVLGGQCGIVGHLTIADQVRCAARTGITKSISQKGEYGGFPAKPLKEHQQDQVLIKNIKNFYTRLNALEKKLSQLENSKEKD